jgi:hypothetical protein
MALKTITGQLLYTIKRFEIISLGGELLTKEKTPPGD